MGINKTVFLISTGLLALAAAFAIVLHERKENYQKTISDKVEISKTWELPNELDEVSGIAFLDNQRLACVQDEKGTIFIYNLSTEKIEKEIDFADDGDYEGIAIAGNIAYVVESDGTLFEVRNFMGAPQTEEYNTFLDADDNVEGLFFDREHKLLWLAPKEEDPNTNDYKGVYAFDVQQRQMLKDPVFKLTFDGKAMEEVKDEDIEDRFFPSEINRNPSTGEVVLLEGVNSKLLLLDENGKVKKLYILDRDYFPQPEGLAFDKDGNLYISNEGNPATIHRVLLK
ncbi:MAG: SdiA-regulated domain-containing protein [Salinimicrobium sp.]